MQSEIWAATVPLHITHPSSPTPYLIRVPRVSYLPLLLPRLTAFFGPVSSFSYEDIMLKNLPIGLLCDLYQPELPWRLVLGDGPLFDIHDTFINSVKEVCKIGPLSEEMKTNNPFRRTFYVMGRQMASCQCHERTPPGCGTRCKIVSFMKVSIKGDILTIFV